MRKSVVVISLAVCLSGCVLPDKFDAIRRDVDQGRIQGLAEESEFTYSIPNFHKGPYAGVDDVNERITKGSYKGLNATFILGKSRESGQWEVLLAMVEKDGKWQSLPVKLIE